MQEWEELCTISIVPYVQEVSSLKSRVSVLFVPRLFVCETPLLRVCHQPPSTMRPRPRQPLHSALGALNTSTPKHSAPKITQRGKHRNIFSLPAFSDALRLHSDLNVSIDNDEGDDPFGFLKAERTLAKNKKQKGTRGVSTDSLTNTDYPIHGEPETVESVGGVAFATPEKNRVLSHSEIADHHPIPSPSVAQVHQVRECQQRRLPNSVADQKFDEIPDMGSSSRAKKPLPAKSSRKPSMRSKPRKHKGMDTDEQAEDELVAINAELVKALPTRPRRTGASSRTNRPSYTKLEKTSRKKKQPEKKKSNEHECANGEEDVEVCICELLDRFPMLTIIDRKRLLARAY
jgi:hypothetical protein